jgi:TRAP-type uncharacterized transport system substrate-binding protein
MGKAQFSLKIPFLAKILMGIFMVCCSVSLAPAIYGNDIQELQLQLLEENKRLTRENYKLAKEIEKLKEDMKKIQTENEKILKDILEITHIMRVEMLDARKDSLSQNKQSIGGRVQVLNNQAKLSNYETPQINEWGGTPQEINSVQGLLERARKEQLEVEALLKKTDSGKLDNAKEATEIWDKKVGAVSEKLYENNNLLSAKSDAKIATNYLSQGVQTVGQIDDQDDEDYWFNNVLFKQRWNEKQYYESIAQHSQIHPIYKALSQLSADQRLDFNKRKNKLYKSVSFKYATYMSQGYASYGIFDALFLWLMLDNITNDKFGKMYFIHSDNEGIVEWLEDVKNLAQKYPVVKLKLEQLTNKMIEYEIAAVYKDQKYLPPNVSPDLVMSRAVLGPRLKVATGSKINVYYQLAKQLNMKDAKFQAEVYETQGSISNIKSLSKKEVDAALVQSDVYSYYMMKNPDYPFVVMRNNVYKEYAFLLVNVNSDIKSIRDLTDMHTVYVGEKGSGSAYTWNVLCKLDKRYSKVKIAYEENRKALRLVTQDISKVFFYIGGLNSGIINYANKRWQNSLRLADINDWSFDNHKNKQGNKIYHFDYIKKDTFPNLQKKTGKIKTLALDVYFVVTLDWLNKVGIEIEENLVTCINYAKNSLLRTVGKN